MHRHPGYLLVAASLALISPLVLAEDWPQWRGPHRDGVCSETLIERFPAVGLKIRWVAPVGWGFASPVVAKGRVYLADSEVIKPTAKERLLCFDEKTGKKLWTHAYDVAYEDWAFDPAQEIGPVATPVVDDGKVYTIGRLSHVFCLDAANGDVVWQRDLGKDYRATFAPGMPSPLVDGDLLILFVGGKPDASLVALRKSTGEEVWKALNDGLTASSPIVVASCGPRQLIVWTQEAVNALDPATGKSLWRQRLLTSNEYAISTPVSRQDSLLVGGLMFELAADKPAAKVLWPVSTAPARRILSHTSTALLKDDCVYSAKSSGEFICLDAKTGRQLWLSTDVTDLKGGASIHITANGKSELLYTDRGQLIRARLTPEGYEEISRAKVLEPTFPFSGRSVAWSPPAYANGHIFARSGKELVCASLTEVE